MLYDTEREAAYGWVKEFNATPIEMIKKCWEADIDSWSEITPISEGCTVWSNEYQESAEVIQITKDDDGKEHVIICLHYNGEEVDTTIDDLSREEYSYFPMWGWMWSLGDTTDVWWLENNLEKVAACGFRIYESEEFGYFLGIDGAGYDFYESHWIPLYKARGLRWHKTKEDDTNYGEWTYGRSHHQIVCSKCETKRPYKKTNRGYHVVWNSNYCPNCGNIMYKAKETGGKEVK